MAKLFLVMPISGQVFLVMHKDIAIMAKLRSIIPGYDPVIASFARYGHVMHNHANICQIHA